VRITEAKLRRLIRRAILEAGEIPGTTKSVSMNTDGDPRQVMHNGKPMKVTQHWKQDRIGTRDFSYEFDTPRPQRMADSYINHYEERGLDEALMMRLKRYYENMSDSDKRPMHDLIVASGHKELINYIESLRIDWN
jgi:hypothetical protein